MFLPSVHRESFRFFSLGIFLLVIIVYITKFLATNLNNDETRFLRGMFVTLVVFFTKQRYNFVIKILMITSQHHHSQMAASLILAPSPMAIVH